MPTIADRLLCCKRKHSAFGTSGVRALLSFRTRPPARARRRASAICQEEVMIKLALLTSAALLTAATAFAQTGTPSGATSSSPPAASPGTATSGPGSTGTVSPSTGAGAATGAETRSNNPAGASNAEQPERATPQGGRGGGGGGAGGGGSN